MLLGRSDALQQTSEKKVKFQIFRVDPNDLNTSDKLSESLSYIKSHHYYVTQPESAIETKKCCFSQLEHRMVLQLPV